MRVTVLLGHTNPESFCAALASSYVEGLQAGGHESRLVDMAKLEFDPVLIKGYRQRMELEPDLVQAREDIEWCEHFVLIYPLWWGQMPAKVKGFFDRVFLPGWAFKYHENDPMWDRLLAGRSARLIITTDAPPIYNWIAYRGAPINVPKRMILGFSGFKPIRTKQFGSVRKFDEAKFNKALALAHEFGLKAR
jgi:putative NADPH-quinone reductase